MPGALKKLKFRKRGLIIFKFWKYYFFKGKGYWIMFFWKRFQLSSVKDGVDYDIMTYTCEENLPIYQMSFGDQNRVKIP